MSMKFDKFVCSKGESWSAPNVDALPEIDFDAVAEATNLTFTEDICYYIKLALAEYISQVRGWEDLPLSNVREKNLKSVEKACEVLESFLGWDAPGSVDDDEYDSVKMFLYSSVIPSVNCFIEDKGAGLPRLSVKKSKMFDVSDTGQVVFNGKNVADYLALCREKIQEELNFPYQSGRRENYAIRRCLKWFHQCFILAGGKGRGAKRLTDGTFSGPFLTFSKQLLDYTKEPLGYTEDPFSESALGALVVNKYKL